MSYFNKDFIKFFQSLTKNNSTEWFNENRKTYEQEVKKPFSLFVGEMIKKIAKLEPDVKIEPKDAIMRINKDIRFSKDKTPYNTHVAANISKYGKKDKSYPGFYFQLSHEGIKVFGGAYIMETPVLQQMRKYLSNHLKDFSSAYSEKAFREKFGKIQGEAQKRIPPEFQSAFEKESLIANKQFYYSADLSSSLITSDKLADELMEYYKAGKRMNEFLKLALGAK